MPTFTSCQSYCPPAHSYTPLQVCIWIAQDFLCTFVPGPPRTNQERGQCEGQTTSSKGKSLPTSIDLDFLEQPRKKHIHRHPKCSWGASFDWLLSDDLISQASRRDWDLLQAHRKSDKPHGIYQHLKAACGSCPGSVCHNSFMR